MKIKLLWMCISLIACSLPIRSQEYAKQFFSLLEKNDTVKIKPLLEKWEKTNEHDPELYVAYFNYFVSKSRQEILQLSKENPQKESLQFADSTGKTAGYISGRVIYELQNMKEGFRYIDKGIALFPDRLDMRFGKIHMLQETGDYEAYTKEIEKTLAYSKVNNNRWLWSENKPRDNGEQFLIDGIQDYILRVYNTENDALLVYMQRIAEAGLKYYPKNVEFMSDLSIVYILKKNLDKALSYLLPAEKLAPKDPVILNNIAHCYYLKKDAPNAIRYYKLAIPLGDEEQKAFAQKRIDELQNSK